MSAIRFANFVNGQDVRMVERRGRFRLTLETSQAIRILYEDGGQRFERHLAFEPECPRPGRLLPFPRPSRLMIW